MLLFITAFSISIKVLLPSFLSSLLATLLATLLPSGLGGLGLDGLGASLNMGER